MPARPALLMSLPSYATGRVAAIARRPLREMLAERDLALPHFAVLAALEEDGPSSQQALARRLGIDKSQIVKLVDRVEAGGLAARRRSAEDRRRHEVDITDPGRRLLAEIGPRAVQAQRRLLGALSAGEQRTLMELLARVIDDHH